MSTFAMFGLFFSVPQFYQAVEGHNAFGAGIRPLPLLLGLVIGSVLAEPLTKKTGPKVTTALGFFSQGERYRWHG